MILVQEFPSANPVEHTNKENHHRVIEEDS